MKKQAINLDSSLVHLLQKLDSGASNVCLLTGTGGGWQNRIGWNPCDSYSLRSGEPVDDGLYGFVAKHQSQKHLIVGFLNYDLGYSLYGINRTKKDSLVLPNAVFFAYDNYLEETDSKIYAYYTNPEFINEVVGLDKSLIQKPRKSQPFPKFSLIWDKKSFGQTFKKIQKYIFEGIVYQINLTQELRAEYRGDPRSLFANLSAKNTAKMMAYMEGGGFEIISISPERFVRTEGKIIETAPIKGTRPRGKNIGEDKKNIQNLLADEKEKAELNMITDLLRNDLGKVCQPGSIEVVKRRQIEKLTTVIHTFSLVRGKLKAGFTPLEALVSMFPGGSITGCPKKKAIEIIDELEHSARSAYCGSILVIDRDGDLDSSILIRTIIKQNDRLSLSVGSGIVYDSVEQKEYQENLDKAGSITEGLG